MLGMPKLELPPGAIERMSEFRDEDPELFNRYAERDAEIAARYTLEVWRFLDQIGAIGPGGKLPPTIGAAAVNLLRTRRPGSRHRPRRRPRISARSAPAG